MTTYFSSRTGWWVHKERYMVSESFLADLYFISPFMSTWYWIQMNFISRNNATSARMRSERTQRVLRAHSGGTANSDAGAKRESLWKTAHVLWGLEQTFTLRRRQERAFQQRRARARVQRCNRLQSFQGTETSKQSAASGKQGWRGSPGATLVRHSEKCVLYSKSNWTFWRISARECRHTIRVVLGC